MLHRPSRAGSLTCVAVALAVLLTASPFAQKKSTTGDKFFGFTKRHRIHISISSSEWSVLQTSAPRNGGGPNGSDYRGADGRMIHVGSGFGGYFPWVHADVRADDEDFKAEFKDAGLRYKGNLTFSSTSAAAPLFASFKLKLDQHGAKGTWDGEKTFNLSAGVVDTSHMREAIAFAIFRAAGVPAPRTTYAELLFTVPGIYNDTSAGVFTVIEDVNKTFLERVLPPGTGLLMKPEGMRGGVQSLGNNWSSYIPTYRPDREATPHEQQRMLEFTQLISQPDVALFRSRIGTYLDVDELLRYVAVNAMLLNWDSYLGGGHNVYLYLDPKDDKVRFLPWDEDLSMASRGGGPGVVFFGPGGATINNPASATPMSARDLLQPWRGDQPLLYWLFDDPEVAARYKAIIKEISANVFNRADLSKMVDSLEAMGVSRGPSPRAFLDARAAGVEQLVASWK